jgi:hypothetical protein
MRDLVRIVRLESWSEVPITEIPRPLLHSYATVVSVLSRPRFLCRFTATGLTCEGIKKRANNRHPNSKSGRNVQQKMDSRRENWERNLSQTATVSIYRANLLDFRLLRNSKKEIYGPDGLNDYDPHRLLYCFGPHVYCFAPLPRPPRSEEIQI